MLTCRDLDHLRRLGKDHFYIIKPEENEMHEDDAAIAMADALCGDGLAWDEAPREGKIALKATRNGLLKVNVDALEQFNEMGVAYLNDIPVLGIPACGFVCHHHHV